MAVASEGSRSPQLGPLLYSTCAGGCSSGVNWIVPCGFCLAWMSSALQHRPDQSSSVVGGRTEGLQEGCGSSLARAFEGFCLKPCLWWAETLQQYLQSRIGCYVSPLSACIKFWCVLFTFCYSIFLLAGDTHLQPLLTGQSPYSHLYGQPAAVDG